MQVIRNLWFSFPVQLFFLHLRTNLVLLLIWAILFLILFSQIGKEFGVPYLFLDPEYLGRVNYLSFSLLGAGIGGFIITWHLTTYTLHSFRFPFLAGLERPFAMYCLNNMAIPLLFVVSYSIVTIRFQLKDEYATIAGVCLNLAGFFAGMLFLVLVSALYFNTTNKNIFTLFAEKVKRLRRIRRRVVMKNLEWQDLEKIKGQIPVRFYISTSLKVRPARNVDHYEEEMLTTVFRQHHINALVVQLASVGTLVGLGMLIEYEFFRIPSGTSMALFFSVLVALAGAFTYWFGEWRDVALVVVLVGINFLFQSDFLRYQNQAYGLDYTSEREYYLPESLMNMASPKNVQEDIRRMEEILNAWKKKTGQKKPRLFIVSSSGGGLTAATFTITMMQKADSLTGGNLMKHTALITGASGGMFGMAYFRELYRRKLQNLNDGLYNPAYFSNISKDLLNPLSFTILTNDIFFPWQKFHYKDQVYRKDRGYIFEKIYNENTEFVLDKTLADYREPEVSGAIPLMIFSPTIINDSRQLFISPHPLSFLMRNPWNKDYLKEVEEYEVDAVDGYRLFANQGYLNLRMTTVIRMNGTFPYILPPVNVPTLPEIQVMDAGFRDNYGMETAFRFIRGLKSWIIENTSGIVVVQIKGFGDGDNWHEKQESSFLDRLLNPVTSIYQNWGKLQKFQHHNLLGMASEWFGGNLEVVTFEYIPEKKEEKASLNLHLTKREKKDIQNSVFNKKNQASLKRLQELLN